MRPSLDMLYVIQTMKYLEEPKHTKTIKLQPVVMATTDTWKLMVILGKEKPNIQTRQNFHYPIPIHACPGATRGARSSLPFSCDN